MGYWNLWVCFVFVVMHWNQASLVSDLKDAVNHTVFCGQIPIGTLSMYRAAVSTNMAATVLMIEVFDVMPSSCSSRLTGR